jgi:hypothetical protein
MGKTENLFRRIGFSCTQKQVASRAIEFYGSQPQPGMTRPLRPFFFGPPIHQWHNDIFFDFAVSPSQQKSSSSSSGNDPFSDFNEDEFGADFEEFNRQDRFHGEIEAGMDKWEDRCLKVGGQEALDKWLKAQEHLVFCVMQNFDVTEIKTEIDIKKQTGDLDLVFKKYCGYVL